MKNKKIKYLTIAALLLAFANFFVWKFIFGLNEQLKVVFFDIGQGDSIFVETPQKHQILIDGGPSKEKVLEKLSRVMPFWDRTIDLVVLTHPEYDHLAGLISVFEIYKVENILWNGIQRDTAVFKKWQKAIQEEKAEIFTAQKGQGIKTGVAKFYVLYPLQSRAGEFLDKESNDTSVVLKLSFGKNDFLLTGDISKKAEQELVESCRGQTPVIDRGLTPAGCDLTAKVLKVAHHGSKTSSSKEFLEKVSPDAAVISAGRDNRYGHPHQEVLRNFEEFGINVLRTDELGDIEISANGRDLTINHKP